MPAGYSAVEQWDRYWAFGALHSFGQVAGGNYQGAIAAFWRSTFETLQSGARVVDIATGNGAVALLALEAADAAGMSIDVFGVDLANIDPLQQVQDPSVRDQLQRVEFHARTPAESMPFADASIDLACSQFGLEYSDLDASVPELARVCRFGGRIALMLHHADSLPLQATAEEISQLEFVLERARLYVHARNLLRAMAGQAGRKKPPGGPGIERKQRALNDALQEIQREARGRDNARMLLGPCNYIREIFSAVGRAPYARLLDLLEETRQRVLANRQRLLDMQRAALDEDGVSGLVERFDLNGFDVIDKGDLREHDGGLLGWRLTAVRR